MWYDEFVGWLEAEQRCSPHTVEAYSRDLRQFAEYCADDVALFHPELVTTQDVRSWIGTLADGGAVATTLRRKLQSLRAFYHHGRKTGKFEHNPASDVILPKKGKQLPNFIKESEMEQLLAVKPDDFESARMHIVIEILYGLGLRRAELLALTDSDISRAAGEIRVTGKRNKTRVVPMPEKLADDIAAWQTIRDSKYPDLESPRPLIAGPKGHLSAETLGHIVKRALAGTSTGRKSPHTLRHTFATTMINHGADLDAVREMLGHESLATTQIYTHLSVNELMEGYAKAHPRSRKPAPKEDENTKDC